MYLNRRATRNFSGQERFWGIRALRETFRLKTQEKNAPQGKISELFLLGALKTTFWMEDITQEWTQLGSFFPKSRHFFRFSRKRRGGIRPPRPSCALVKTNLIQFVIFNPRKVPWSWIALYQNSFLISPGCYISWLNATLDDLQTRPWRQILLFLPNNSWTV